MLRESEEIKEIITCSGCGNKVPKPQRNFRQDQCDECYNEFLDVEKFRGDFWIALGSGGKLPTPPILKNSKNKDYVNSLQLKALIFR